MKNDWLMLAAVTELALMFIIYIQFEKNISLERNNVILEAEVEILRKYGQDTITIKDTVFIEKYTTIINKPEKVIYKGYEPIIKNMPWIYDNNSIPDSVIFKHNTIPL